MLSQQIHEEDQDSAAAWCRLCCGPETWEEEREGIGEPRLPNAPISQHPSSTRTGLHPPSPSDQDDLELLLIPLL